MQTLLSIIGTLAAVVIAVVAVLRFAREESHQQQAGDLVEFLERRTDELASQHRKAVFTLSAAIGVFAILSLIVQLL